MVVARAAIVKKLADNFRRLKDWDLRDFYVVVAVLFSTEHPTLRNTVRLTLAPLDGTGVPADHAAMWQTGAFTFQNFSQKVDGEEYVLVATDDWARTGDMEDFRRASHRRWRSSEASSSTCLWS